MAEPGSEPALRRAAALVAIEGLALVGLGLVLAVRALTGEPDDRASSLLLAAFVVAVGAALGPVARGLDRVQGWAWAPTILLQVFGLVAAVGSVQGDALVIGIVLAVLALAVLYQLATPEARAAYQRGQVS